MSLTTLPVPSVQDTWRPLNPFSPVYTTAKFSSGSPSDSSNLYNKVRVPTYYTNRLLWKSSSILFVTCSPTQNCTAQITDALAKITQLQRLPQAAPSVFKGKDSDKTRFLLWENAFNSLIDSVPVTARQKLHLLYQCLDSKAKTIVEQ